MTLAELKTQVRALLAYELEGEAVSDSTLLGYIHHALRDFALQAWWRFSLCRRKDSAGKLPAGTSSVDFSDSATYVPPLLQVRRVWWEERELQLIPQTEVGSYLTVVSSPRYMIAEGSRVQLFPIPSTEGVVVAWGIRYPDLPAQDTDVVDFPAGYEHYLAHGVAWQLAYQKGVQNSPNVLRSLQTWQTGIALYRTQYLAEALRDANTLRW